jgi:hypothetical protein
VLNQEETHTGAATERKKETIQHRCHTFHSQKNKKKTKNKECLVILFAFTVQNSEQTLY